MLDGDGGGTPGWLAELFREDLVNDANELHFTPDLGIQPSGEYGDTHQPGEDQDLQPVPALPARSSGPGLAGSSRPGSAGSSRPGLAGAPSSGQGFGQGGALDAAVPGVALAAFADRAHADLAELSDDEVVGVMRAWARQEAWSQACKLAAVAEIARRRPADGCDGSSGPGVFPENICRFASEEAAFALRLTARSGQALMSLAVGLATVLTSTAAALEAGRIDLIKAKIMVEALEALEPEDAQAVEARVLPVADSLTYSQLRRRLSQVVAGIDPAAARRRRKEAEKSARVQCWMGESGTGNLEGHDLPAAETLAADKRICQIAKSWKKQGAIGGMDLLRARAYLALLLGQPISSPPADLLPPADAPAPAGPPPGRPSSDGPRPACAGAAEALPPVAGAILLTVPLDTLLGLRDAPGEAAGYGVLHGDVARDLARAALAHRGTDLGLVVTDPDGRALGYGHGTRARARARPPGGVRILTPHQAEGWTFTLTTECIAGPGYVQAAGPAPPDTG